MKDTGRADFKRDQARLLAERNAAERPVASILGPEPQKVTTDSTPDVSEAQA